MGEIAVLGLGPSLSLFHGDMVAIGVNDIWSRYAAEYVVCVDPPERFSDGRRAVIESCAPKIFFSQLTAWRNKSTYRYITLQIGYPDYVINLDGEAIPKSLCSPFVACCLAYKMGYNTIHIYGVDLADHPILTDASVRKIIQHFKVLFAALSEKGVTVVIHGVGVLQK